MSRSDIDYYADEMARDEFVAETLKNISEDGVRTFLAVNGDAVDFRVQDSITLSKRLNAAGFHRHSIVAAVTAIELIIRFLLIRPLIQAAFLSEDWAYLLTQRIATGRTAEDRKLLPSILEFHDINIAKLKLSAGPELWKTITDSVYGKRDRIVHSGESATAAEADVAIECATLLHEGVVLPLAKKIGLTLDATGYWHKIKSDKIETSYPTRNPFDTK